MKKMESGVSRRTTVSRVRIEALEYVIGREQTHIGTVSRVFAEISSELPFRKQPVADRTIRSAPPYLRFG